MTDFLCKVVTAEGVIRERTVSADSVDAASKILKEQKEQLISIKKKGMSLGLGDALAARKKVSPKEMSIFVNQLKVMTQTGVSITKCLDTLERQASSEKFKGVVQDMHKKVIGGQSLSQSMSNHPEVFSNLFVNMIEAGEAMGKIDTVLEQLEIFTEIEITTNSSVKKALRYPVIVLSVVVIAGGLAMVKIIPSFAKMFASYGQELPTLTKALIGFSNFLGENGLVLVGVIAAIIFGAKTYIKTSAGAFKWDMFKLKAPILSPVIITSSMARFALIMKTLLLSGVVIVDAMEIAKKTIGNLVYERELSEAKKKIVGGVSISKSLESEYIPSITCNMIAIGEETGSITTMLETVSSYFLVELEEKLDGLTGAIEPIVTIVLGLFIGMFVGTIFIPMFKMISMVGG